MQEITVSEAAGHLGISEARVRAMASAGTLPARKLGGLWLLHAQAVDAAAREERTGGRPLAPRMCWGLVALAEGDDPEGLSASERSRLRARLRQRPPVEQLSRLARRRAVVHHLHVHPGVVARALRWPGAVPTGVSASGHDLIEMAVGEIYLPGNELDHLVKDLRAMPSGPEDTNLVVRVPAVDRWPFGDRSEAGPAAVALDLAEADDSRSRRTAERLWRDMLSAGHFEPQR